MGIRCFSGILLLLVTTLAWGQSHTVRLPDSLCGGHDSIFADGFDTGGMFHSDPSLGMGGNWPGSSQRSFTDATYGQVTYYAYVPSQYDPSRPSPLMVVLHGAAGTHAGALQQAEDLRDQWQSAADSYGFVIVVPVASGAQGGWVPSPDYDKLALALEDAEQRWNIERNRVSLWGFSAGGYIAWDMVLSHDPLSYPTIFSVHSLATLAVSGANASYACGGTASLCDSLFAGLGRRLPVDVHMGNSDPRLPWAQADRQRMLNNGWLAGVNLDFHVFAGGHTYTQSQLEQVAGFACRFAVQP